MHSTLQILIKKKKRRRVIWPNSLGISTAPGVRFFPSFPGPRHFLAPLFVDSCLQTAEENIILAEGAELYPEKVSLMWQFPPRIHEAFDEWTLLRRPASRMRRHLRWERIWVCFPGLCSDEERWGYRRQTEGLGNFRELLSTVITSIMSVKAVLPLSTVSRRTDFNIIILVFMHLILGLSAADITLILGWDLGLQIRDREHLIFLIFSATTLENRFVFQK